MKFMVSSPGGILENTTRLIGYDNMCYMLMDEPDLLKDIFDKVGQCYYDYYSIAVKYDSVGLIMINDDWGFNTQTMFAPDTLREYVFPWTKKLTEMAHNAGKPVVLHSCGNLTAVMDDIIDDMKFNGKHSYEDKICPVEDMYDILKGRIAVLGGIDIDFVARRTPQEVYERCYNMVKKTNCKGYALGTGNSIPEYIPHDNFFAMLGAVLYNG
jgi:uroporphyrinogen decarboxylase